MSNNLKKVINRKYLTNLGRTCDHYRNGKTPEEISVIIKQPIESVLEMIEKIKKADKRRSELENKE